MAKGKRFDHTATYEEEVSKIVDNLKRVCVVRNIPMFLTLGIENTDEETIYKSEMLSPDAHGLELTDNIFPKLVNVLMGFDTVPPSAVTEIDFEK